MAANRRVLVVDDDPGVREAYQAVFAPRAESRSSERLRLAEVVLGLGPTATPAAQRPFQITLARQGQEAVHVLEELQAAGDPPAVAFVDMRMPPGWDGLTTIQALWRVDPRLQCVLCTAFSDFSWEEIIARLGATDRLLILRKPFDRIEVLQMAESLCAKWESAAEVTRQQTILRGIIDHPGLLISLKDAEGRYLLANRGFCQRYGVEEAHLRGQTDAHVFPAAAATLAARDAAARQAGLTEGEEQDPCRPGADACLQVTRRLLPGEARGDGLLVTLATDVSNLHALEARLIQSQKMEALGRLAGGVAHDFNNLLAAIIGFTELALGCRSADERARGHLQQVLQAGTQAADLTRQLLAFSRRQVLKPQRLDVQAVVEDLVAMLRRLVGGDIHLVLTGQGPAWVVMDKSQLQQVLVNLVVNARDALPKGGQVTIHVDGTGPDGVLMEVIDDGIGMTPDVLQHIWDPFFTTKPEGQGTGLGLATVQGTILQSGGTIAVTSQPGAGTRFTIRLPRAGDLPTTVPEPAPVTTLGGRERILVVDDREEIRDLLVEILEDAGYQVASAADAQAVAQQPPACDLLLTDVVMPGLDGPGLVTRLRQQAPHLPVLFMTGHTMRPDDLPGPVLAKPFSRTEVLAAVRRVLG